MLTTVTLKNLNYNYNDADRSTIWLDSRSSIVNVFSTIPLFTKENMDAGKCT